MEILDAVRGRRSIRRYRRTPIPENLLETLEESLREAPSAGNLQARRFYFVFREEIRKRLSVAAFGQEFIEEAPLSVVCCADLKLAGPYGDRGRSLYCLQDVAASIQNLMLVAYSLGLGTVWVGAFDERETSRILSLPAHLRPVAIIPVGFPAEKPVRPRKVPREESIVSLR